LKSFGLLQAMLQSLKTNARLLAKEKWYDWRLQLTIGVQKQIEAMNLSLKEVSQYACHHIRLDARLTSILPSASRTRSVSTPFAETRRIPCLT
jgi:hypothetical protein